MTLFFTPLIFLGISLSKRATLISVRLSSHVSIFLILTAKHSIKRSFRDRRSVKSFYIGGKRVSRLEDI